MGVEVAGAGLSDGHLSQPGGKLTPNARHHVPHDWLQRRKLAGIFCRYDDAEPVTVAVAAPLLETEFRVVVQEPQKQDLERRCPFLLLFQNSSQVQMDCPYGDLAPSQTASGHVQKFDDPTDRTIVGFPHSISNPKWPYGPAILARAKSQASCPASILAEISRLSKAI